MNHKTPPRIAPADRLSQVSEYYFSRKLEEIRLMRVAGKDVINLGIGSPDLMPSPEAIAAAAQSLQSPTAHSYASYRSTPELRNAIAEWMQKTYGVSLSADKEILPLLGSKEGILYLSLAYLNPGDQVLVPNPGYPAYSSVAALIGAKVVHYDLTEQNQWFPDLAALDRQDLSRCKLMRVNYPHMPTGASATAEQLKKLVAFGKRKDILIANDNPYGLILNRERPVSLLSQDPAREITVELNSLSKSFNMAGWRVGMILASEPIINAVLQVKSNVDSGMFLPVQAGATVALQNSDAWHEARNTVYARRRALIWKLFTHLGFTFDTDQVGLFVWAKAPDSVENVEAWIDELLQTKNVFLTPGFIFGSNGRRYVRASLCAPEARLTETLNRVGAQS